MTHPSFSLWLEFELWDPAEIRDPADDFFNMQIRLADGRRYALNVWTYDYLRRAVQECREDRSHLQGAYLIPPDLLVERLDRGRMEAIVAEMLANDELRAEWLCPDQDDP